MNADTDNLTLSELSELLHTQKTSAVQALQKTLDRIEKTRDLNNFITLCPDALGYAERADARIKSGERGVLLGVPVAVKDNISTAGVRTTCASRCLSDYVPDTDADIVKRLKSAGAVIVGKTNMDEFAMGSTTEYSAFGCAKNALDASRVTGGSSGGSANSVAAGQVTIAIGSDTGGSVRQPAAYCGVVGLKPTYGALPTNGLIGMAPSLDALGILANNCDDAYAAFAAIVGYDDEPLACDLKGATIGIAQEFFATVVEDGVGRQFERAISLAQKAGAIIKRVAIPSFWSALDAYHILSSAEAAGFGKPNLPKSADFSLAGSEFKRRIAIGRIVTSCDNRKMYYEQAAKLRAIITSEYERALCGCDVLLSPTAPNVATKIAAVQKPTTKHGNDVFTAPVALGGFPAVSVPFGRSDGMPVGLQVIGKRNCERKISSVGKAIMRLA